MSRPACATCTASQGCGRLLPPATAAAAHPGCPPLPLAADASIWLFQFIQAMRDERGELIRNAHVLGFFRRITK